MHNAVKALNVTELCTFKWLIVCYVNFTAIKKKKKMGGLQELKTMGKNFTPHFPDFQGSTQKLCWEKSKCLEYSYHLYLLTSPQIFLPKNRG